MEYRRLGNSDLNVSAICFGCWAIGGRGWGDDVDDRQSIAAIHKALDLGINFFDTADVYGFGHSEEILGRALKGRREGVVIATKVGNRWDESGKIWGDLSREYILTAVDDSLRRLGTDVIDLYQVHRPDNNTPIQETMEALLDSVKAGKVRYIGLSNQTPQQIREYLKYGPVVSLQPPLNLLYRYTEVELLPLCQEENIGVIPYSPLARGLLTGKYDRVVTFPEGDFRRNYFLFEGKAFERNIRIVRALKAYAERFGRPVSHLALAWLLAHPAVTAPIVGAKRPEQIEETAAAYNWKLGQEELKTIDRIIFSGGEFEF